MEHFIVRHNEIEHVWRFKLVKHGFETYLFVRGTESEVRAYIDSEYPEYANNACWYSACSKDEVDMIRALRMKVYIAPEL